MGVVEDTFFLRFPLATAIFLTGVNQSLVLSKSGELVIVVVAVEECLNRVPPEISEILLELWIVKILPLLVDVFQIEIVL